MSPRRLTFDQGVIAQLKVSEWLEKMESGDNEPRKYVTTHQKVYDSQASKVCSACEQPIESSRRARIIKGYLLCPECGMALSLGGVDCSAPEAELGYVDVVSMVAFIDGFVLRSARKAMSLSLKETASRAHTSESTIKRLEHSTVAEASLRILQVLKLEPNQFPIAGVVRLNEKGQKWMRGMRITLATMKRIGKYNGKSARAIFEGERAFDLGRWLKLYKLCVGRCAIARVLL